MHDGPWLYYKLTNKPKGSGELKISSFESNEYLYKKEDWSYYVVSANKAWASICFSRTSFLSNNIFSHILKFGHLKNCCNFTMQFMDGWFAILRPFNSISVISGWLKGEHERLCAMTCRLGSERIHLQRDSNQRPRDPKSGAPTARPLPCTLCIRKMQTDWQTAQTLISWSDCSGGVWSESTLFAQTCMSQYLGSLRYLLWISPGLLLLLLLLYGHHLLSLGLRLLALHLKAKQSEHKYCSQMIIITIKTRGPLVLYCSPECWGYVKISGYWGKEVKYSPWTGADNSLGPKFLCQREGLSLWSFVASLKRISSTSNFIHIFSCL